LCSVLSRSNWRIHTVKGLDEALAFLRTSIAGVVVAPYRAQGDLSWRDLLEEARRLAPPPRVVVADRLVNESMWAEALNLGAHDVLAQPFDSREVFHVLSFAWRSWWDEMTRHRNSSGVRVLEGYAA
jgi:DNA-binding NtrC family response regulator